MVYSRSVGAGVARDAFPGLRSRYPYPPGVSTPRTGPLAGWCGMSHPGGGLFLGASLGGGRGGRRAEGERGGDRAEEGDDRGAGERGGVPVGEGGEVAELVGAEAGGDG